MRDVIIALDFSKREEILKFLENFDESLYLKVGMQLFYSEGPEIVRELKQMGHRIFLDLKIHDIPNTCLGATKSVSKLGVDMVNYHIAGGYEMLRAASDFAGDNLLTIGVTMLTSNDKKIINEELLIPGEVSDIVLNYAKLAKKAGLKGVVCSAMEVPMIKETIGEDFLTITPGIRLDSASDDQRRVVTPKMARELGSDFIVVGRPIRNAKNPKEIYEKIRNEFLR